MDKKNKERTTPPPASQERGGVALIAAERERQQMHPTQGGEGWTQQHDDYEWDEEQLACAAAAYALPARVSSGRWSNDGRPFFWPWDARWWKPVPSDRVRELVKAGALIAAEIDRLQRASPPSSAAEHRLEMFTKSPGLHESGCPLSGTPNLYASCDCGLGAAEQAKPDMAADDAFAAHIAKLDQDELEAEQAKPDECHCPQHGSWIAADDVKRLVREIDVYLNGEAGAAKQASLCDIAGQLRRYSQGHGPLFPVAEQTQAGEVGSQQAQVVDIDFDGCPSCGQPQAVELPPRCAAARTLSNETLVEVALQTAGRASMIDSEIHRNRYRECRTELLRRLAGGVTSKMIVAAMDAYVAKRKDRRGIVEAEAMRAALVAALGADRG